jgi:hypothetical protein
MRLTRLVQRINPFKHKSTSQRLVETVEDTLSKPMGKKVKLPDAPSAKTLRTGAWTLAGVMGLTAGSAGVSSLRRRAEAPKGGS